MHSPAESSRPRMTDPPGRDQVHPEQLLQEGGGNSPHCCRHNSQQRTSGSPRLPGPSCRRGRFRPYPRAGSRGRRHWARLNGHVARLSRLRPAPSPSRGVRSRPSTPGWLQRLRGCLAAAWHARFATLTDLPEFRTWRRVQATIVMFPRDGTGSGANHSPHRHRRHILLHLCSPGRNAPAQPLGPARRPRPNVGRDSKQWGSTRPCAGLRHQC